MTDFRYIITSRRLALAGLWLVVSAMELMAGLPLRHYYTLGEVCDSVAEVAALPTDARYVVMEARGSMPSDRERRGESDFLWGIRWGGECLYEVTIRGRNTDFGNVSDEHVVDVTASHILADGSKEAVGHATVTSGMAGAGRSNTISVEMVSDSVANVYVGKNTLTHVLAFAVDMCGMDGSNVWSIVSHGCWQPSMVMDESEVDMSQALVTDWTYGKLVRYFDERREADMGEGIWKYFDRNNNPDKGVVGGKYVIATVRNTEGGYDMIYLDG